METAATQGRPVEGPQVEVREEARRTVIHVDRFPSGLHPAMGYAQLAIGASLLAYGAGVPSVVHLLLGGVVVLSSIPFLWHPRSRALEVTARGVVVRSWHLVPRSRFHPWPAVPVESRFLRRNAGDHEVRLGQAVVLRSSWRTTDKVARALANAWIRCGAPCPKEAYRFADACPNDVGLAYKPNAGARRPARPARPLRAGQPAVGAPAEPKPWSPSNPAGVPARPALRGGRPAPRPANPRPGVRPPVRAPAAAERTIRIRTERPTGAYAFVPVSTHRQLTR